VVYNVLRAYLTDQLERLDNLADEEENNQNQEQDNLLLDYLTRHNRQLKSIGHHRLLENRLKFAHGRYDYD
jgi:hypothetical protein